jgi:ankyrin repeat protein
MYQLLLRNLKEGIMLRKQKLVLLFAFIVMAGCNRQATSSQENGNARSQPTPSANEMKDAEGRTILMRTAETGDVDAVRKVIDEGADVNSKSESGVTALMTSSGMGHAGVTRLLIEKGADVNATTPGNYTALMNAALTGQREIIQILLDAGAEPDIKDVSGKTAKDYALMKEHEDIAQLIERRGSAGGAGK